jgi:hypothetical protein
MRLFVSKKQEEQLVEKETVVSYVVRDTFSIYGSYSGCLRGQGYMAG